MRKKLAESPFFDVDGKLMFTILSTEYTKQKHAKNMWTKSEETLHVILVSVRSKERAADNPQRKKSLR